MNRPLIDNDRDIDDLGSDQNRFIQLMENSLW
jgi:hypothetical protein